MPRSITLGFLFALLGMLAASAASAQPSPAQQNAIRQNCRADYQSLCSAVPTGGSASLQCLQEHAAQLSPACGQAVGAIGGGAPPAAQGSAPAPAQPAPYAARPAAPPPVSPRAEAALVRRDCGPDYRMLCRGVPLGGGRAVACLSDQRASLSNQCRGALMALRGER